MLNQNEVEYLDKNTTRDLSAVDAEIEKLINTLATAGKHLAELQQTRATLFSIKTLTDEMMKKHKDSQGD